MLIELFLMKFLTIWFKRDRFVRFECFNDLW